jgi:hypothetical protein
MIRARNTTYSKMEGVYHLTDSKILSQFFKTLKYGFQFFLSAPWSSTSMCIFRKPSPSNYFEMKGICNFMPHPV